MAMNLPSKGINFAFMLQNKALERKQEQEADAMYLEEAQKREVTTATVEDEMKNKARYELEIYIFCVREQSRIHQKLLCLISSLCLFVSWFIPMLLEYSTHLTGVPKRPSDHPKVTF